MNSTLIRVEFFCLLPPQIPNWLVTESSFFRITVDNPVKYYGRQIFLAVYIFRFSIIRKTMFWAKPQRHSNQRNHG